MNQFPTWKLEAVSNRKQNETRWKNVIKKKKKKSSLLLSGTCLAVFDAYIEIAN